jgi:uncharacterized membrane protein
VKPLTVGLIVSRIQQIFAVLGGYSRQQELVAANGFDCISAIMVPDGI